MGIVISRNSLATIAKTQEAAKNAQQYEEELAEVSEDDTPRMLSSLTRSTQQYDVELAEDSGV